MPRHPALAQRPLPSTHQITQLKAGDPGPAGVGEGEEGPAWGQIDSYDDGMEDAERRAG